MDLFQLAERSAAVTGDFLVASAAVAATQAGTAVGSAVAQLVMGRLGISPATSEAVPALQAAPDDETRRSNLAAALRDVLNQDPAFARQLEQALEAVDRAVHAVASGPNSRVTVGSPVTASGRAVVVGGDQHNIKRVTKKSGALWTVIAVVILGGITAFIITQNKPESSRQKAEKAAVDFVRAGYSNDIETMCGLTSAHQQNIAPCRTEQSMKEAQAEAKANPIPDDQRALAQGWVAESSNLPSDNTALVTTVNKQAKGSIVVHLTRESGDWRVTSTQGGMQRTP